jgi:hypothetical protein
MHNAHRQRGEVPLYLCKYNEEGIGEYDRRSFELTWISEDDKAGTVEMASPPVALVPLVVQIHDKGGMSSEGVRLVAGSTRLNGCTIEATALGPTSIYNVPHQRYLVHRWLCYTPHLPSCCCTLI